ncbi:hypothetical protein [Rhodomicrobium sp. R_RK_3]|uniref:hypothetical protein n=1 Tax=Rhodomicrobium sp. R_RK_3 TaxID=2029567 RepID=UPI000F739612|nr:hypothetical protein [Rhodomicrobium sp. R_RK_3]
MRTARVCLPICAFAVIAAGTSLAQPKAYRPAPRKPARTEEARICEPVQAVAVGFGLDNVTTFVQGNLDLAINEAKDTLASRGLKAFLVQDRTVTCEDYIDFGGAIGREQKCRASARLCGKPA